MKSIEHNLEEHCVNQTIRRNTLEGLRRIAKHAQTNQQTKKKKLH